MHAADTVHAVIDILPEPMLLLDGGGQVLQANRAARELLDRDAPDPTGQPLSALLADAPAALQALLRQGLRSPQFSPGRVTACAPQGGGVPLRCEVARVAATADHPVGVLMRLMPSQVAATRFLALNERIEALSREVARRQRAEEALRTQSEWLEAVLRSIGDAVVATDAQGAVVFMNSVAEGLCGVPAALAAGQPVASVFTIVDGATRATAPCPVARTLRERCIVGLDAVDVVVTDYNMPGLDGLQLAAELRRLRPGLPLILTSGFFSDAVSGRARALGGVWLLNKEDSFERLPALIEEVLSST